MQSQWARRLACACCVLLALVVFAEAKGVDGGAVVPDDEEAVWTLAGNDRGVGSGGDGEEADERSQT